MKRTCVLLVVAMLAARPAAPEIIDRVMAVVAGQPITLSDVNAALAFGLVAPPPAGADPLGAALAELVDRALMLGDVERYQPPEPAPETIAEQLTAVRQRLGARYVTALKATGMSEQQLQGDIRDNLRIRIYLNQRFSTADAAARSQLIADWLSGLRRRTDVTVLYLGNK